MGTPGIAIVTPVHGGADFLQEMLASVRAQTRPPDEVILVDDGSRDRATKDLLAQQAAPVRVIHQEQAGPGLARNVGVRASTSALIFPLDSDDLLHPECLAHLERALLRDPGASFAFSHVESFGADAYLDPLPPFNPLLQLDENLMVVSALVRREVFEREGCWYPPLRGYEDWSFWLSVAERGLRGTLVEEPLFRYRRKQRAGLLFEADRRKQALLPQLHALHPKLFTADTRARWKPLHAPGVELLWPHEGEPPREWLKAQTLRDFVVTTSALAREMCRSPTVLLRHARGRFVLPLLSQEVPAALAKADALVQAVRALQGSSATIARLEASALVRVSALRTLRPREVPETWDALVAFCDQRDRAQGTTDAPPSTAGAHASPIPRPLRALWKLPRSLAEKALGAERVGLLLQPLKTGLGERSRRRLRDEAWAAVQADPPLLPASRRRELELRERVPVDLPAPIGARA
ncbi:MAG: glycosyltransferase family 2 protein [Deltaproteobacteria bacterium]|nr:glycosyltransferase family 2 protein [Deltaproteobacteria bacterium]